MSKVSYKSIKGSGDTEHIRNSRVNPLTLTCDLALEFR